MATEPTTTGVNVGEVVAGRFRVTGIVGKGAMGAVYAAEHTTTGQKVALKFMVVGDDEGQEFVTRFEQEARVMAGLKHPNTIRIYDFGANESGALFMAMELLTGEGLDRRIREHTRQGTSMPEAEVVGYGIQVLKSLAEAHGQGLVHRDLKPGNVFLAEDGSGETICKVLDFGIARVQNSGLTNAGRILGTPSYMSPEQWSGEVLGPRSDLYAVGCILYSCVTGQPPYAAGDNVMALMKKHCFEPVPDPRKLSKLPLSDGFVQVLATAMAKDPHDRFVDAKAMRAALEAAAGGAWAGTPAASLPGMHATAKVSQPLTAREFAAQATLATDRAVLARPTRRVWPLLAALVAGVLALAGGVAWWVLGGDEKDRPGAALDQAGGGKDRPGGGKDRPGGGKDQPGANPPPSTTAAPPSTTAAPPSTTAAPPSAAAAAPEPSPPAAPEPAAAVPAPAKRPPKPAASKPAPKKRHDGDMQMVD